MAEVNEVAFGTVRRILPYGAIVQLEDGSVGLVHISEIANCYVSEVSEYCSEGARVAVRVLHRRPDGRWEFSMKAALEHQRAGELARNFGAGQPMYDGAAPHQPPSRPRISPQKRAEFDEKLRDFLSDASDSIEDVRRHHEHRLGGKRR